MGKCDVALYEYLEDKVRFADLFNGVLYNGEEVVTPDMLESDSERSGNRFRDLKKQLKNGDWLAVAAMENQESVDYSMPLRMMEYDCLEYMKQMRRLRLKRKREVEQAGGKADNWSLRLDKGSRLNPVHSVCVYHGTEEWNGPRCLKDMMDFEGALPGWEDMFHDYGMTLFCVNQIEDFSKFRTELRQFLEVIPCRKNKKLLKELLEREEYKHLDRDTAEVIAVFTDNKKMIEMLEEEQEEYDMCKALDDLIADGKAEGIAEGISQGISQGIERVNKLIKQLLGDGRSEDVERVVSDVEYQNRLFAEYNL